MKSIIQTIRITDTRPDIDRACALAYEEAIARFDIDEHGHAKDTDFPRSSSSIHVEFVKYQHIAGIGGQDIIYTFKAWMQRED